MRHTARHVWLLLALVAFAACSDGSSQTAPTTPDSGAVPAAASSTTAPAVAVEPPATAASTSPSMSATNAPTTTQPGSAALAAEFPVEVFARISESPVTAEAAAEFQALLETAAGDGGMSATVMTADGTWHGVAGTADGIRPIQVDDQFAIGSITKPIVAAQVMQLVEAGELSLDDPAADHLPADLEFDTNRATIRQLLSHHSGLREPDTFILPTLGTDRLHMWTIAEVLELAGDPGWPAGSRFEYSNANYFLLGLIIEQARGRPLAEVLRDGVLAVDGTERLIYQPEETPSEPMAMPAGESADALELGGGYLPSIASATGGGPGAAMASDSPSLARWWQAFCAGEVVSSASLSEMTAAPLTGSPSLGEDYGIGVFQVADPYAHAVGHTGTDYGYVSWAGCLPEYGAVVVVLANREIDDIGSMARPFVTALETG